MTTIPTPYVFIAFNKKATDNLFTLKLPLQTEDIISKFSGETGDYLLFSNYANPNIISLEHTQQGSECVIKIELIDPKNEFESKFVGSNFYPEAMADAFFPSTQQKLSNDEKKQLQQKGISEEEYKTLLFRQAYANQNILRKFYVAYGAGTNIESWAGPFECTVNKIDISLEEFKKITLHLTPTNNFISLADKAGSFADAGGGAYVFNYYGMRRSINGSSSKFTFDKYVKGETSRFYGKDTKQEETITSVLESLKSNTYFEVLQEEEQRVKAVSKALKYFDLHLIVTDAIRDFIRKATGNPNVIVLLPNLNYLLLSSNIAHDLTISEQKNKDNVFNWKLQYPRLNNSNLLIAASYRNRLADILGYLTISLNSYESNYTPEVQSPQQGTTGQSLILAGVSEVERSKSPDENVVKHFTSHNYYASISSSTKENQAYDPYARLMDVIDRINRFGGMYKIPVSCYYETNRKIIKVWEEYHNKKDSLFTSDVIVDPTEPWIVFGDSYLISKFLYGGEYISKDFEGLEKVNIGLKAKQVAATPEQIKQQEESIKQLKEQRVTVDASGIKEIDEKIKTIYNETLFDKDAVVFGPAKGDLLHPLDATVLTKDYNFKVYSLRFPEDKNMPFGSISEVPDEFLYSFKSTNKEKLLKGKPVFRFNTKNSNVLKLKMDLSPVYLSELMTGFNVELQKRAVRHLAGPYDEKTKMTRFLNSYTLQNYIANKLSTSLAGKNTKEELTKELLENFKTNGVPPDILETYKNNQNLDIIARGCVEQAQLMLNNKNRPTYNIDIASVNNVANIMFDLTNQVYTKLLEITIETVPMYHLSSNATLLSDCLVFAQAPQFVGTEKKFDNSQFNDRDDLTRLASGLYRICGFKHKMSMNEMSSEFKLIRPSINNVQDPQAIINKKPKEGT